MENLYDLILDRELMFQIHPVDVGPGCLIVFTDKRAKVAYEAVVTRDQWLELCNNPEYLEDLVSKANVYINVATAREETKSERE